MSKQNDENCARFSVLIFHTRLKKDTSQKNSSPYKLRFFLCNLFKAANPQPFSSIFGLFFLFW